MPNLKEAIHYCAAVAATEDPIPSDLPRALPPESINTWIDAITALLAKIDEQEALEILATVEIAATAFASGRFVTAVLSLLRLIRTLQNALAD